MVPHRLDKIRAAPHVAGVDGCPGGWLAVVRSLESARFSARVYTSFAALLNDLGDALFIAVDIPIGLPDSAEPGGRACDRAARALLGPGRTSSVFSPPSRPALRCLSYAEALAANRASSPHQLGFSIQAFNITPKIREVDECMEPPLQERVREVHPELCFRALNGDIPLVDGKKSPKGRRLRARLLGRAGYPRLAALHKSLPPRSAALDDLLDACAACWTATRLYNGEEQRVPPNPPRDGRGLRMEICW